MKESEQCTNGIYEIDGANISDGGIDIHGADLSDEIDGLDCIAGTIQLLELDGNNWMIGNDGTDGTDWAETINGADRTYITLGKLIIT